MPLISTYNSYPCSQKVMDILSRASHTQDPGIDASFSMFILLASPDLIG
jgi:hypothetical protein